MLKDVISEAQSLAGIEKESSRNPDVPIETTETSQSLAVTPYNSQQTVTTVLPVSIDKSSYTNFNSFRSDTAPYGPGRFSPPLGDSLWLDSDRVARLFDVPLDVAPYLGEGLSTLAACLYWACVNHTVFLWREFNQPGAVFRTDRNRLDRLFNHSKYLTDREFLVALANARLGHKRKKLAGGTERWLPPTQEEATKQSMLSPLYQKVRQEYEERGERVDWWKNPQEVEEYMRMHMSDKDCADLQAVVEGRASKAAAIKFAPLVESLAETYVCFGDSPRWNAVQVSMTIGMWLRNKDLQAMVV